MLGGNVCSERSIIFHRTLKGNQSDQWLNGQVTLRSSSYYRLQIEGIIGK